ncbi:Vgb family protein [Arthrobacter sp. QXT-31]|uniref:Vgb family protein n=1 Tax=Arthrobacter sp. QXT-31 TaxID=1357915 RepID=UPI0012FC5C91|nr:YncE family protein [Arthrobacter sp. QXT-31]
MRYRWAASTAVIGAMLGLAAAPAVAAADEAIYIYGTPVRVAIAADGTAYLGNYGQGGGVFVVPSGTTKAARTLSTGGRITTGLALGPDGTLYVATAEGDQGAVGIIPPGAAGVERTVPVSAGLHPLAAGPDGTVYVANPAGNSVSVIAPNGTAVDRTIKVGAGPAEIAVTKDGTAFVTSQTAGTVSVIPAGADTVSKTIELISDTGTSEQPHGIAAGPDGTVYVANIKSSDIAVIKPGADTAAERIFVGGGPQDVAIASDGSLYITSLLSQKLSVIRPHAKDVAGSIPTDGGPGHLAVAPDGSAMVISPAVSWPGDGAVVRYSAAALAAASQGSTAAALSAAPAGEAAVPAAAGSGNALPAGFWYTLPGGVGAAVVALAAWILVKGRRRQGRPEDGASSAGSGL